jgi:hypothetical protein
MILFGHEVSLEEGAHHERKRIFLSGAHYALTEDEVEDIMKAD